MVRACTSTTAPTPTPSPCRRTPTSASATCSATGSSTETSGIKHIAEFADNGLIASATLAMDPGGVDLTVEPLGFGALYLEAPDGRVSHFPRAMVRLTDADGRRGLGWMEWNRNQKDD